MCYKLQLTAWEKKKIVRFIPPHKWFQKPVYYTLNTSIFSDPLIILLNDAQARDHVALPTHDDWPITAVSSVLSNLQWFARYDLRIDYPFLGWPSSYISHSRREGDPTGTITGNPLETESKVSGRGTASGNIPTLQRPDRHYIAGSPLEIENRRIHGTGAGGVPL